MSGDANLLSVTERQRDHTTSEIWNAVEVKGQELPTDFVSKSNARRRTVHRPCKEDSCQKIYPLFSPRGERPVALPS